MKRKNITAAVALVVFLAIAISLGAHHQKEANRVACIETLRLIDSATARWEIERYGGSIATIDKLVPTNVIPTWNDIALYGSRNWVGLDPYPPRCPSGGTYTLKRFPEIPTCSIPGHVLEP